MDSRRVYQELEKPHGGQGILKIEAGIRNGHFLSQGRDSTIKLWDLNSALTEPCYE
ncbi:unnamed protein product, partial [Heterosigma akashiwo]